MKYHYSRSTWNKSREADVFEDQEKVLHVRFWEDQEDRRRRNPPPGQDCLRP